MWARKSPRSVAAFASVVPPWKKAAHWLSSDPGLYSEAGHAVGTGLTLRGRGVSDPPRGPFFAHLAKGGTGVRFWVL